MSVDSDAFFRDPLRRRLLLAVCIGAALVGGVLLLCVGLTLPLRWIDPPTSSFMIRYARATPPSVVARFDWQPMDRIAPSLAVAVIAAEDQRFLDHGGFDFESIASALEDNQSRTRPRGASTITQQLAKNLYLWPGRNMIRKGLEAGMTLFLELCLPKRRILEIYLNVAQFGPGVYGAGAAATAFFDKPAAELTAHESALLAAVLPSPSRSSVTAPSTYVQTRAAFIERQSRQLGGDSLVAGL